MSDDAFDHIMIAFSSEFPPMTVEMLHRPRAGQDVFFGPLAQSGSDHTADLGLWRGFDDGTFTFPFDQDLGDKWQRARDANRFMLIGLLDRPGFRPPGSTEELPMERFSSRLAKTGEFVKLGFDVVDTSSVISGLFNCGYSAEDARHIRSLGLTTNASNLFDDVRDALAFCDFADSAVEEHAPFEPVMIAMRSPR